jgi:glycosyltransferase involved in cell wall biosynthesis
MRPAVSVIVPAYRVAPYSAATLESILAQTWQDREIVVVNDGSPDTAALIEALAPFRDRIVYLEQPQGGPSKARNTAIAAARGEWLAFLDGDDLWHPSFLEAQLARLRPDPEAVLVWADSQPFGDGAGDAPTLMTLEPPVGECDVAALLSGRCVVFTSTTVARRQTVVDAGGFDEGLQRCEDFDLWLRLATRGRLIYNREVLGRRRLHATSQSASPIPMLRAQIDVRQRFVAAAGLDAATRRLAADADRRCEAAIARAEGRRLRAATLRLRNLAPRIAVALDRWRQRTVSA